MRLKRKLDLVSVVRDGQEIPYQEGEAYTLAELFVTKPLRIRHSCELAKNKKTDYRTALYVTKYGVKSEDSVTQAISGGEFDKNAAEARERYCTYKALAEMGAIPAAAK